MVWSVDELAKYHETLQNLLNVEDEKIPTEKKKEIAVMAIRIGELLAKVNDTFCEGDKQEVEHLRLEIEKELKTLEIQTNRELEEKKIELESRSLDIEEKKIELENKQKKRESWLNFASNFVKAAGTLAGVIFGAVCSLVGIEKVLREEDKDFLVLSKAFQFIGKKFGL